MAGAYLGQRLMRPDRPLDEHLHAAAAVSDPVQTGMQDTRVVEHQQVACVQQAR